MSKIAVHPLADEQSLPEPWVTNLHNQIDQIREKAYELFEAAGKPDGQDLHHGVHGDGPERHEEGEEGDDRRFNRECLD